MGCDNSSKDALESSFTITDSSFDSTDIVYKIISRDALGNIENIILAVKLDERAEKIEGISGLSVELNVGLVNDTINYWGANHDYNYANYTSAYLNHKDGILYLDYMIGKLKIREFNCMYISPFVETSRYMGYTDNYFWGNTLEILGIKGTLDDPTAFLHNEIIYRIEHDTIDNSNHICFFIKTMEPLDQVDSLDFKLYVQNNMKENFAHINKLKYNWLETDSLANTPNWCKVNHIGRNGHDIATIEFDLISLMGYSIDSMFISFNSGKRWYATKTPIEIYKQTK